MDEYDNLDRGTVRVLSAGTFLELGVVEANITGLDPSNWAVFSVSLPAAAVGQSIVLEFGFESDGDEFLDASGWYVDDVLVTTPAP